MRSVTQIDQKLLQKMLRDLEKAQPIYHPSRHWQNLNTYHLEQLIEGGFDNFKRSVNMKYFNWGMLGIVAHQMSPVIDALKSGNLSIFFDSSFKRYNTNLGNVVTQFDFLSAQLYKVFVASLYHYVSAQDKLNLLDTLQEPSLGNPFLIRHKDRVITQDLCNSVLEFYSIINTSNINNKSNLRFAELGAGYGRLAYVFLKALPHASYCIIDIPLALYISQEYLSRVFPNEKIFYYKPFKSYKEIRHEFESSRIKFLMAHQIELLPDKLFDHINTISSLHEMTRRQIKNYVDHIDRLGKGYVYIKQWRRSRIKDNNYITEHEYSIPKTWATIYHRQHPVQAMFFEALYKL